MYIYIYYAATGYSWLRGRVLDWPLSQPSFDPSYGKLVCLATLMNSDRTKQIRLWMTIYIYKCGFLIYFLNDFVYRVDGHTNNFLIRPCTSLNRPMDSYTWTHQCWLTSKDLHTLAQCRLQMLFTRLAKRNELVRERESQGNLCNQLDTMMMVYIYIYIYIDSHPQTDLFRSIRNLQCG